MPPLRWDPPWLLDWKLQSMLLIFLIALTGEVTKATSGKKGLFWLTVWCCRDGRDDGAVGACGSWSHGNHSQEAERDEHWYSAGFFLLNQSGTLAQGQCCPHLGWVFPFQLNLSGNAHTVMPRGVPMVTPNQAKLMMKVNHHIAIHFQPLVCIYCFSPPLITFYKRLYNFFFITIYQLCLFNRL